MRDITYRPWGSVSWLLSQMDQSNNWDVIGCIGTEQRSVRSGIEMAKGARNLSLVQIDDPAPISKEKDDALVARNFKKIEVSCGSKLNVGLTRFDLKASLDTIDEYLEGELANSEFVILDITSFPKRWFFPMVRKIINMANVSNFVVAYTQGEQYPDNLSENPELIRAIPSFVSLDERKKHDVAFVGVGYHTHKMMELFMDDHPRRLEMLFPFPPGPTGMKRNWRFVEHVERVVQRSPETLDGADPIDFTQITSVDVSQAFDVMKIKTESGKKSSVMAPYGPKPFSLAMCLFSIAAENSGLQDVPVYYSQPQRYNPEYTKGASHTSGQIDSWGYAIKHQGRFLYDLST